MRRLGHKKTGTRVEGHQDCGICHPDIKGGKARERETVRREVAAVVVDGEFHAPTGDESDLTGLSDVMRGSARRATGGEREGTP